MRPQDAPHSRQLQGQSAPAKAPLPAGALQVCLPLTEAQKWNRGFYSSNSGAGPAPECSDNRAKRPTKGVKAGLEQKCVQFVRKHKRCWTAKAILRKKNEAGGIRLPDFRLCYRTTVIKSVDLNKNKYRSMEEH